MNTTIKKILVSLIGLFVITIIVCSIFEDKVQEGLGDEALLAANAVVATGQRTLRSIMAAVTNGIRTALNKAADLQASMSRNIIAARAELADSLRYTSGQTADNARFASERASDTAARGTKELRDSVRYSISTLKTTLSSLYSKLNMLVQWMKILTGVAIVCILGGYFYKVGMWFVKATLCGFTFLFSFNVCFIWYALDIIGKIIYSFIWLWFCGLWDGIIGLSTGQWDILQKGYWNPLMQVIDAIDCYIYDLTGFHVFHFSKNVIEKCYKCEMPDFPPFPDLFSKDGIKDAYNKYGLGSFIPGFRAI